MRYKIGTVSKILGLARETLRYYERYGIVIPEKEANTGYRYYDSRQINHLMLCKMYRQMGFGSSQILELMQMEDIPHRIQCFALQKEQLLREIEWKRMVVCAIDRISCQYSEYESKSGAFFIEQSKPLLTIRNQWDNQFTGDQILTETIHRWLDCYPVAYHTSFYPLDYLLKEECSIIWGFSCDYEQGKQLKLDALPFSQLQPECECACTVLPLQHGERIDFTHFRPLLEYIHSLGKEPADDAIGYSLITGKMENYYRRLQKIMIPVKDAIS